MIWWKFRYITQSFVYIKLPFSGIKDMTGSLKYEPKLQEIYEEGNLTSIHVTKVSLERPTNIYA
jgi:hypothetical protein